MAKYDHGGGCACGLYKECIDPERCSMSIAQWENAAAEDAEAIDNIQKLIGTKIDYVETPVAAAPAPRAKEEPRKADREERDNERSGGRDARRKPERKDDRRSDKRDDRRDDRRDAPAARPAPHGRRQEPDDGPDDGGNGPVPEFLNFGFGG